MSKCVADKCLDLGCLDRKIVQRQYFIVQNSCSIIYRWCPEYGVITIAYSFGKTVIATNIGSIAEVVENGVTGYLVPPRDSEALAEAIITLLKMMS